MIYEKLKPKEQQRHRNDYYYKMLLRYVCSRFDFKNLPDTITNYQFNHGILTGRCAFYNIDSGCSVNSGFQVTPAFGAGVMKNNLTFNEYTTYGTDYSLLLQNNDDFVILQNGDDCLNDLPLIDRLANVFTNIDCVQEKILKWSKKSPIFKSNSGIKSAQLKNVLTNIIKNDTDVNIVDDNIDLINPSSTKQDFMIELSKVSDVSYLHFLSEFYDDMLKRFCTQFGLPFSTTSKSAQNCIDELHDMDLFSRLYNMETFRRIKKDVEKVNKTFNLNISVDYSEPFKQQISEIVNRSCNNDDNKTD